MPVDEGDSRDDMALTATFVLQVGLDGSRRGALEKAGYIPLWTQNNWSEVQSGQARLRDIRVLPTERLDMGDPLRSARIGRVKAIAGSSIELLP